MRVLQQTLKHISAFLFAAILLLAFASVFCRYVLNNSIVWSEEVIRYAFIWMFFLSMPEVTRSGSHIALDLLPEHLHGKQRKLLDLAIEVINNVFLVVIIYYGVKITSVNMAQSSPALRIPYGTIYAAIPAGGLLMLLFSVQRMIGLVKSKPEQEGGAC